MIVIEKGTSIAKLVVALFSGPFLQGKSKLKKLFKFLYIQ